MKKKRKKRTKRNDKNWAKFTDLIKSSWRIIVLFIIVFLFSCFLFIFPGADAHERLLSYVSFIISWPGIVLILGVSTITAFKEPLKKYIGGLVIKARTPQGGEYIFQSQPSREFPKKEEAINKAIEATQLQMYEFVVFEYIIRKMYRSQFHLLKHLKNALLDSAIGIPFYYGKYIASGGTKEYKMEQYIAWLQNQAGFVNFVEKSENFFVYSLTERGKRFLIYCDYFKYTEFEFIGL